MDAPREILVDTADALDGCSNNLAQSPVIGLDTEFVGEHSYHPELCLIQVATETALYLIDPFAFESLTRFWERVVDPGHTVVVHAGREEVRLCHLAIGRPPANLVDLQIVAGLVGYPYPLGHGPLIQHVLGRKIRKGETLTEWRTRPLTPSQIRYAFDDVRFLLPVWARLEKKLRGMNRFDWATDECARLRDQAIPEAPTDDVLGEKWRKLRGLGSLDRRKLAFVRELFLWREQKAHEWNRPARVIVRDDLLVEVARRNPKSSRDLAVIRGLAHKFLDDFYAIYQRVQKLTLEECPNPTERDQDPVQINLVVTLMTAVLPDLASRERLAPNLVASNNDLRLLVRAFQAGRVPEADTQLVRGWRREAILPHLLGLLEGRQALRVADLGTETPFEYRPWSAPACLPSNGSSE
jgi:ribonuclease D